MSNNNGGSGMRHGDIMYFVPSNLDLIKTVAEHAPEYSKHIHRFFRFVNTIYHRQQKLVLDGWRSKDDGYINLKAEYLRDFVGRHHYQQVKRFLQDRGIVECDNTAIVGQKSYGFRFADTYAHSGFKIVAVQYKGSGRHRSRNNDMVTAHLDDHLSSLSIDQHVGNHLIAVWHQSGEIDDLVCNALRYFLEYFARGEDRPRRDQTVRRFHSRLTRLPKKLRQFLRHPLGSLVQLDIANSQCLLLNTHISQYTSNEVRHRSQGIATTTPYLLSSLSNNDVTLYRELTTAGKFYEYLADLFTSRGLPCDGRDHAKALCFSKVFFCEMNTRYLSVFREAFPTVGDFIASAKRIRSRKRHLAVLLQLLESRIVLDCICKRMAVEHPQMFVATIHDSLIVLEQDVEVARGMMLDEFQQNYGLIPTIHENRLTLHEANVRVG